MYERLQALQRAAKPQAQTKAEAKDFARFLKAKGVPDGRTTALQLISYYDLCVQWPSLPHVPFRGWTDLRSRLKGGILQEAVKVLVDERDAA